MILRSDHIAGAAFIIFGVIVFAISGDLPFGRLSAPGAGMMPKLVTGLMMAFGLVLVLSAAESRPFAEIEWSDGKHALMVTVVSAIAVSLYAKLGFIITMVAMMVALLIIIERRKPLHALGYSAAVTLATYVVFVYLLKTPLPYSPFSY